MKVLVPVLVALWAATTGCTTTNLTTVETGLFENKPDLIAAAYDDVEKKVRDGEVVTVQYLEELGFDLKAPNIESVPGPIAFKRIFGDAVFQNKHGVEKPAANLDELSKYRGYFIPYQSIETTKDRFYFSEREVFRKGTQLRVFLMFKEDQLCYQELRGTMRIDTYESHYAFAEGLLILLKGPGKAALGILETLNEYQRPGLEFVAPIPIIP